MTLLCPTCHHHVPYEYRIAYGPVEVGYKCYMAIKWHPEREDCMQYEREPGTGPGEG